ncbi:MAG: hypothetical protein K9J13_13915 [Saprospiraceae bacterium]|nr:hypothetical protein [Saprospiraceae bacterium]
MKNISAKDKKLYINAGVIILVLVLLINFAKLIKKLLSGDLFQSQGTKDLKDLEAVQEDVIKNLKINFASTSISEATAQLIAEDLFEAMNKTILGFGNTNEQSIDEAMQQCSLPEDRKLVFKCFGLRPYGTIGTPSILEKFFGWYSNLNLQGWLKEELTETEYLSVKNTYFANGWGF